MGSLKQTSISQESLIAAMSLGATYLAGRYFKSPRSSLAVPVFYMSSKYLLKHYSDNTNAKILPLVCTILTLGVISKVPLFKKVVARSLKTSVGTAAMVATIDFAISYFFSEKSYSPEEFIRALNGKTFILLRFFFKVRVTGDLDLSYHSRLTALPEGFHVEGDLNLSWCKGLTALPEGLHVEGDLDLSWCEGLTTLPEGLHVGGDLVLSVCRGLTTLPKRLYLGGNLNLIECSGLTSQPSWITTLGRKADGSRRIIYLRGVGFSKEISSRLSADYTIIT